MAAGEAVGEAAGEGEAAAESPCVNVGEKWGKFAGLKPRMMTC